MQNIKISWLISGCLLCTSIGVQAIPVGLEISLLIDTSGSISTSEFNLQKQGYVDAFNDPTIQDAIASGDGVAVTLIYWSSAGQQSQAVPWTLLNDRSSATAFATQIGSTRRPFSGNTGPGSAINFAKPLFDNNGYEGRKLIMDVSGDGIANTGSNTAQARDSAIANGITINGLPIANGQSSVVTWYANNVIGGPGAFYIAANDFNDFGDTVKRKIGLEVAPIPIPGALSLLGSGILSLFSLRSKVRES